MKNKALARVKNASINATILAMATFLALCLGEVLVRFFSPQQLTVQNNKIWLPDPLLGWKKAPFVNEAINTGERPVWIVTDSSGYRIGKQGQGSKDCQGSILYVGDSFLEALQVENEDAFPALLSRKLQSQRNVESCAVNTGVGGWGLGQYYLQAKVELEKKRYDLLIVNVFVGNDFISEFDTVFTPRQPVKKHKLRIPASLEKKELELAIWRPVKNYFSARSHLFVLLKNSIEYYSSKSSEGEYIQPIFLKSNQNSPLWERTVFACKQIEAVAKRKDTPVIFCLLPTNYQVNEAMLANYLKASGIDPGAIDAEQPNEIFSKLMKGNGLLVLDPLQYFRQEESSGPLYGEVDRHFNEKGHLSLAEFMFPAVDSILNIGYPTKGAKH